MKSSLGLLRARSASSRSKLSMSSSWLFKASSTSARLLHDSLDLLTPEVDGSGGEEAARAAAASGVTMEVDADTEVVGAVRGEVVVVAAIVEVARVANEAGDILLLGADDRPLAMPMVLLGGWIAA